MPRDPAKDLVQFQTTAAFKSALKRYAKKADLPVTVFCRQVLAAAIGYGDKTGARRA